MNNSYKKWRKDKTRNYVRKYKTWKRKNLTNCKTYDEASQWARRKKIKSLTQWNKIEKPKDIPTQPQSFYKEWKSWWHFLQKEKPQFISYKKAKDLMSKLEIYSTNQYRRLNKKEYSLPSKPDRTYKNARQWKGWKDFCPAFSFINFEELKLFIKEANITKGTQYYEIAKKGYLPKTIPRTPDKVYKKEWKGWNEVLPNPEKLDYEAAKRFVKALRITTKEKYLELAKNGLLPKELPATPSYYYGGRKNDTIS